jgi:hypothetical protein
MPDMTRALESEFVLARITMDQVRNSKLGPESFGSEKASKLIALARFGPIGTAFELRYIQTFRTMFEGIVAHRGSVLQMHRALIDSQIELETRAKHDWTYTLTELMSPVFEGIPMSLGEAEAKRRVLLAAIDLLEVRRSSGTQAHYVAGTGPLWVDPFTEKTLIVHSKGSGFLVYSVGRDEKDNGGKQRPKNAFYEGYDITFSYP